MKAFQLDGVRFRQVATDRTGERSQTDDFVLVKDDVSLRFFESLRAHLPKAIMEIGTFEGGSLVYFDKLYKPTKLVGVDRRVKPVPALEDYRRSHPYIETFYARFQEKPGVLQAARQNFPKGIDLVVDDASHLYTQTKATFDMLFPLLREGGHYVIEHWRGPPWPRKDEVGEIENAAPASSFVHELIDQVSQIPALAAVTIEGEIACVRRGPGTYDAKSLAPPTQPAALSATGK